MTHSDHLHSRRNVLIGTMAASTVTAAKAETGAKSGPTAAPGNTDLVDRSFVRLDEGLVHYRSMGDRRGKKKALPVLLAHAGPGSSSSMVGYMPTFAKTRYVFAPDMLGNGDSAPPAKADTDISYYVDATIRVMDALGVEKVDFLGAHTGAQIGLQMAVDHPNRIRRLALDGVPLFPAAFQKELLENYAPEVPPDDWGGHLAWAWSFIRNQSLYWPHYAHTAEHRLANGLANAEQTQRGVMDVLKALSTYHIAYRAAFRQDVAGLLPRLSHPTLLLASRRDPLSAYLDAAADMVKGSQRLMLSAEAGVAGKLTAVSQFFEG